MPRYRITVVEETVRRNSPVTYQARADLGGSVEAATPTDARKVTQEGISRDRRFEGMTLVAINFRDASTIHVVVRSAHLSNTYKIPGGVYKAPQRPAR